MRILGLTRVRNEELIFKDTLDHMIKFVDGIVVYDDASVDKTPLIALRHPGVIRVIRNKEWGTNRPAEETRNRAELLNAGKQLGADWFFYFDADERFEGNIREDLLNKHKGVGGIRIKLYDAYMTPEDSRPYDGRLPLLGFRKMFGPERRDILMIWRNKPGVMYAGMDMREPVGVSNTVTDYCCQHYGKALSEAHWEETCDYYIKHFPTYAEKWRARKGKAVHTASDFGRKLLTWPDVKKKC